MTVHYRKDGRRQRVECPCPKCRHLITKVVRSGAEDGGQIVRRRLCPACDHRWFTLQEPEYVVKPELVRWSGNEGPTLRSWAS